MNLTPTQQTILSVLKDSGLSRTFYWTGGTLLSVHHFHHRYSYDLDFFSEKPFSFEFLTPFLWLLKQRLGGTEIQSHKIYDRWEFIIEKPEQTRLEFVYYNHEKKRLKPLQKYLGISIDSLDDIAANKLMAYFDRNEPKDLYDVYFLITKGNFKVTKLIDLVKRKFGVTFSEFSFWSESAKSLELLVSLKPLIPQEEEKNMLPTVKQFFLSQGKLFLDKTL